MAADGRDSRSLASIKASLDRGNVTSCRAVQFMLSCGADFGQHTEQYDPDAFDSMAVMNSEIWNLDTSAEGGMTTKDLLPNVRDWYTLNKTPPSIPPSHLHGVCGHHLALLSWRCGLRGRGERCDQHYHHTSLIASATRMDYVCLFFEGRGHSRLPPPFPFSP